MSDPSWGALAGLAGAIGLLLLLSWLSARRSPRVGDRIAPYVQVPGRRARASDPVVGAWRTLVLLVRPGAGSAGVDAPAGGSALVRRLQSAGRDTSVDHYRLEQVVWCALGAASGLSAGAWLAAGGTSPLGVAILAIVGGLAGWLARDRRLGLQASRRTERIEQQLPTVAELLAFAVAAGESPMAALERAAACTSGDLSDEVLLAVADIRSGTPLESALRGMADRSGAPALRRFVDGIAVAVERGTPLADVMRAQAADARAGQQRALMEAAGRKDAAMLVPVVFLILPTVVLIALFPGVSGLRLIVP
jgi:tight adherence protein C